VASPDEPSDEVAFREYATARMKTLRRSPTCCAVTSTPRTTWSESQTARGLEVLRARAIQFQERREDTSMDNKEMFDEAIGELGPSTVDMDEVITRGRRSVVLRRVVSPMVGAAAAAVVLLLVVGAAILPTAGRSNDVAITPSETTSMPSDTSSVPTDTSSPPESSSGPPTGSSANTCAEQAAETRQRFTVAVRELIEGRMSSGFNVVNSPVARDNAGTAYGPLEFFQKGTPGGTEPCEKDRNDYLAHANAEVAGLMGSITVKVSRSSLPIQPCPTPLNGDLISCEKSTGPNGEHILSRSVNEGESYRLVTWVNKNGVSVEVTSSNGAEPGTQGNPGQLPIPPLDPRLQVEIALDSRIVLP
jgi:hypothetical protein